jgi:Domain of unknown function DUF1829/Domain of unknown function DUF1828
MNIKNEMSKLIDDYLHWLKDKTILKEVEEKWVEITTPHLDRHNDCLQIYVKKNDEGYLLTDDGYIISDLLMSGCSLNSSKRQKMLKTALAGFGVQLEGEELIVRAGANDFPLKKHNLIQAMLTVNDFFYFASPHVTGVFFEDVSKWMDLRGIRYTPNVKFAGKSGYDHQFDFVIPKSHSQPERIIQMINNPRKNAVESLVFKWGDTRETRSPESKMFALLNNAQITVHEAVIDALHRYDIQTILWTKHEKAEEILIA